MWNSPSSPVEIPHATHNTVNASGDLVDLAVLRVPLQTHLSPDYAGCLSLPHRPNSLALQTTNATPGSKIVSRSSTQQQQHRTGAGAAQHTRTHGLLLMDSFMRMITISACSRISDDVGAVWVRCSPGRRHACARPRRSPNRAARAARDIWMLSSDNLGERRMAPIASRGSAAGADTRGAA